MDVHDLDRILLAGAAVLLVAIVAVRLSGRLGLPSLLIYLGMGLLLGESGLGIQFENAELAHALGFAALVIILTEGGLTTRWNEVRPVMPLGVVLATVGVAISVGVVACVAHFILGLDWQISVLLGAVTSPTDAAAVFSVLRKVPIRPRLRGALEAESGLNDAPTVLLVTLVSTGGLGDHGLPYFAGLVVYELVFGALFGLLIGWAAVGLLRRVALGSAGLYPLAIVSMAFLSYAGGTVLLHVSGFAAVYVTSLVLGRAELPHRMATRSFVDGIAWLAQIGLFVMLGLLASPSKFRLNDVLLALVIGIAVTVVGRFAAVAISATPFRIPWNEQTFIAWAGLRGAVPIVLATIPLAEQVPQADRVFNVVFVLVLLFTLLQGPSLPWVAKRLGVLDDNAAQEVDIDVAPLESLGADMLQVRVPSESKLAGVEIGELRLPQGVSISLVIRGTRAFVPDRRTVLRAGDALLVVAPSGLREQTVRRLRAVSRAGRLAGWFGERGRENL
ncbi:cell volume regulation protein A [Kribbella orskensis]|uniref:Cell volume regulation protein A n=1 Tax=Kribbella orskensis TaxID=2512216 RepID=A0ABY2B7V7_9ACTN|nr:MULTISPECIES: potassium/proton antiporter [Kribbella]TCN30554.1 cell volume regulation protein A [Kribbella sp. VKM Ac-2500]TCO11287.1 cell volume regulation protein A [Kribbella orskensis]